MTDHTNKIKELEDKLHYLLQRQNEFFSEIRQLQQDIRDLKAAGIRPEILVETAKQSRVAEPVLEAKKEEPAREAALPVSAAPGEAPKSTWMPLVEKSDIERFIGENLISKIGIVITVIGVAIGARYAISHDLISPLTRIILGYLAGLGLLAFAWRLKKNYENFSAVLLSGSMAIMYFITYAAYSFYGLMPQLAAFGLMVVFTVFTVFSAMRYNMQIIAHIGLVGAYAVPFLLSSGSGRVAVLFSYMAIINAGILFLAFKKYWKPLYYSSFGLSWIIFIAWYASRYQPDAHFSIALIFLSIFFVIFYLTFLAYKLVRNEKFYIDDVALILANSFIFYGIGYYLLDGYKPAHHLLGVFTLVNAIIHAIVSAAIYRRKLADRNLFYLVFGLVLVFVTIAIPVELDGNWVTLLWAGEAAVLFWIGRTKAVIFYEKLSYPLMILASISLIQDWVMNYMNSGEIEMTAFFNVNFLGSLLFTAAFGFINFLNYNKKYPSPESSNQALFDFMSYFMVVAFLVSFYYTFRLEIANYWNNIGHTVSFQKGTVSGYYPVYDIDNFRRILILNYSIFFVAVLSFVNFFRLKNSSLGILSFILSVFVLGAFLIQGLYVLGELRGSYLIHDYVRYGAFNICIRYICFLFVVILLAACRQYVRQDFIEWDFRIAFDLLLHICILAIASNELINWMAIAHSAQTYKLGLSILWGVYSLLLIALGIWRKKKHLRIMAFGLFGITLLKLFFYDISQLDTIAKTVVFVSLGILLLIISFLYNKYKHIISAEG